MQGCRHANVSQAAVRQSGSRARGAAVNSRVLAEPALDQAGCHAETPFAMSHSVLPLTKMAQPALWKVLREGVLEFDAERFWHAHEAWEAAWHRSNDPTRSVLKGIIQFAAVQHHLQRGRCSPAYALLERDRIGLHLGQPGAERWPFPCAFLVLVAAAQYADMRRTGEGRPRVLQLLPWFVGHESVGASSGLNTR